MVLEDIGLVVAYAARCDADPIAAAPQDTLDYTEVEDLHTVVDADHTAEVLHTDVRYIVADVEGMEAEEGPDSSLPKAEGGLADIADMLGHCCHSIPAQIPGCHHRRYSVAGCTLQMGNFHTADQIVHIDFLAGSRRWLVGISSFCQFMGVLWFSQRTEVNTCRNDIVPVA